MKLIDLLPLEQPPTQDDLNRAWAEASDEYLLNGGLAELSYATINAGYTPVSRPSMLTGRIHTRAVAVDAQIIADWEQSGRKTLVQNAFPALGADDREFILNGITPEEWNAHFPEEEA